MPRRGPQCEESDDYTGVVAVLNSKLRVIRGKCGLQWIVQKKERPTRWTSFAYCGTKEGLLLRCAFPQAGAAAIPAPGQSSRRFPPIFPKRTPGESERASSP